MAKQNNATKLAQAKRKPRGKPFENGNNVGKETQFKSREENGGELDPKINVGGRPKVLTEATKRVLESRFPRELIIQSNDNPTAKLVLDLIDNYAGKDQHITYAEKAALELAWQAANGDQEAMARAARFTESNKLTWQGEIVALLREGKISADVVLAELGDELASTIFIAAGIRRNENGETEGASRTDANSAH